MNHHPSGSFGSPDDSSDNESFNPIAQSPEVIDLMDSNNNDKSTSSGNHMSNVSTSMPIDDNNDDNKEYKFTDDDR